MFEVIHWNLNPEIFHLEFLGRSFAPRWYGICFATGLLIGYAIMKKLLMKKGYAEEIINSGFVMVAVGTVVGARLGHCLFYEPAYYLAHPWKILYVWEGGLASHGGTIGVILSFVYFCRKYKVPFMLCADYMALAAPITAACIRLGNFFNSEIIGKPTDGTWGIVFERVDSIPRHPAQLYESAAYFVLFIIMALWFKISKGNFRQGRPIGFMFIWIFASRIFIEYVKENQVDFENGMFMNMGQILSLPMIALGLFFFFGGYQWLERHFHLQGAGGGPTGTTSASNADEERRARRKLRKKSK